MSTLPDPVERINARIDSMADEVGPDGKCMNCRKSVGHDDLHAVDSTPCSPAYCWDCCVKAWGADPTKG